LSKFENKLCNSKGKSHDGCGHSGSTFLYNQIQPDWDACPRSKSQVEVVEKDLIDQVIDDHVKKHSTRLVENMTRGDVREMITEYVKRMEAERKPCDYCVSYKKNSHDYCGHCGRKL
jgi:acetyl-CoA carboxylase beta subunit